MTDLNTQGRIRAYGFIAGLAVLCLPGGIIAQEAVNTADPEKKSRRASTVIEEVVVTGDLIQRQLIDNASSIAVYDEEALQAEPLKDLYDLLLRVPNVTASREDKFSLRGISNQMTGRGRTLANIFIDGIRQQGRGVVHTFDVEQIEIYRGPQSTAFGPSSLAGAIYVKTADPAEYWTGRAKAGYGSYNTQQVGLSVSGPITDSLGIRVTADRNVTDGDIENITLNIDDWQKRERNLERVKLSWDPGESGGYSAMLTAQHSRLRAGSELLTPETAKDGKATDDIDAFDRDDSQVYGLTQSWDFSDTMSLRGITTFSNNERHRMGDYDVGPEKNGYFILESDYDNVAQELRLSYNGDRVRGVVGAYISNLKQSSGTINEDVPVTLEGITILGDATTDLDTEVDTRSIFGEADISVVDWLTLTLGARIEENEHSNKSAFFVSDATLLAPILGIPTTDISPVLAATVLPNQQEQFSSEDDIRLPKVGLTFHLAEDLNLLLSYTSGYRAGGAELSGEGEVVPFDPEQTYNYDLGLRYRLGGFNFSAGLFYVDWRDQQVRQRVSTTTLITVNAGRSEVKGAELEASYQVTPRLGVIFGAGYVETLYKDFKSSDGDFSGNEFPYAPHYNYSTSFNYSHENGWFLNMSYSYSNGAYTENENLERLRADSYGLLSAKLGYSGERYSVHVYGQNLLDDYYVTDHYYNESLNFEGLVVGDPREFGVVGEIRF